MDIIQFKKILDHIQCKMKLLLVEKLYRMVKELQMQHTSQKLNLNQINVHKLIVLVLYLH